MDGDMTPQLALDTAITTRRTAIDRRMPGWMAVTTSLLTPAGFVLVGASDLSRGRVAGAILGGAGLVLFVVVFALYLTLSIRWWRGGVIPDPGAGATTRQRWRRLWLTLAGLVGYAAVWTVTGRVGWALVYAGAAFAIAGGYDLFDRRRR